MDGEAIDRGTRPVHRGRGDGMSGRGCWATCEIQGAGIATRTPSRMAGALEVGGGNITAEAGQCRPREGPLLLVRFQRNRGQRLAMSLQTPEKIRTLQGLSRHWGSGRYGQAGGGIGFRIEELAEPGAELAVDDGAADLEQEIGAAAGPAHLLLLVHAAVDQEVGGAFGDRGADPLTGAMTLGIVDQPSALAGEIAVDLAQRRPQPARRGVPQTAAALALEGRQ